MAKEVLKFLVGFQAAHWLGHLLLHFFPENLPQVFDLGFFQFTLTTSWNFVAIFYNAVILLVLIYFAYLKKKR